MSYSKHAYREGRDAHTLGESRAMCKYYDDIGYDPDVSEGLLRSWLKGYDDQASKTYCESCFGSKSVTEHHYPGGSYTYRCPSCFDENRAVQE